MTVVHLLSLCFNFSC